MIHPRLIPYIEGMTSQTDRLGLISHYLICLNKLLTPLHSAFYDIYVEQIPEPGEDRGIPKKSLVEPLDPNKHVYAQDVVEGLTSFETGRARPYYKVPLLHGTRVRYLLPIMDEFTLKSCVVLDFPSSVMIDLMLVRLFNTMFVNLQKTLIVKDQDPLTGLNNRRSFDESISQVLDQISYTAHPNRTGVRGACLAVLDIDHFKRVNDSFGHAIGDEILILFARIMEHSFRHGDKLYRFGGEEFLVILVEVDKDKAHAALERFRQQVESTHFPQAGRITVSIGSVMVSRSDYPPVLIEKADQALYYSKEHGRNQSNAYEDLLAAGMLTGIDHISDDIELWT